jgi:hypothetical protein
MSFRNGEAILRCHFATTPFELTGAQPPKMSVPCQSRYHVDCFRLTIPFHSRLADEGGLFLPPGIASILPIFICECCTVRAVLGRELTWHPRHRALMLLERMRVLDMVHQWAPGTITQYKSKIMMIRTFETNFCCPVLRSPMGLRGPPAGDHIPLMWTQQFYSMQRRQWSRSTALGHDNERVAYGTVRTMRSAASLYHTWLSMVEQPGRSIREHGSSRPIQVDGCIPTDTLEYSMMSTGMSRRLGENSTPAMPLLARQISWMDDYLDGQYRKALALHPELARELAMAGCCNLLAWLAWLRGGETFGVTWADLMVIKPGDGATQDLPAHVGAILIKLLQQTKTCRSSVADVAVAFCTSSGLSLGKWLTRIRASVSHTGIADDPAEWAADTRTIFCHPDGRPWDSTYYRQTFLLPLLQLQRLDGDPYLQSYDGSPGHTLAEAFYSMHCYRRGARTHVSHKHPGCIRRATIEEINEHGRWRRRRASESMAEQYRQWPLRERLAITLLCM